VDCWDWLDEEGGRGGGGGKFAMGLLVQTPNRYPCLWECLDSCRGGRATLHIRRLLHRSRASAACLRVGRRRMMWFQREEPGAAAVAGFGAVLGGGAEGGGAERDKESSANQAFRRSGHNEC
jgi:hypothetical protein